MHSVLSVLSVLVITAVLLVPVSATLHCATQEEALELLRAACMADLGCRWFFGPKPWTEFSHVVVQKLQLARSWESALAAATSHFHGDDDIRHHFWPQHWREGVPALLTFGALPSDSHAQAVQLLAPNCTAMTSALVYHPSASPLPPSELRDAVHLLVEYAVFMADERQCNPENEVLVINPDTNDAHCMLAAGHVCASGSGNNSLLAAVAMGMAIGLLCVVTLQQIAVGGYVFYKLRGRA